MLKNIFKILKKYRFFLITSIAGIISVILTFITPATKIYYVNFTVRISDEIEFQRILNSKEINREDLYQEITESINELAKFEHKENSGCKIALHNKTYNTYKFKNFYLIEFQLSHSKENLNATSECYGEIEQIIKKINDKYIRLTEMIYTEKFMNFKYRNDMSKNSYEFKNFLNNDEVKINKNILVLSKKITETESLFDNKITRFFCYFIILSFLFTLFINYKKFELLIKKYRY